MSRLITRAVSDGERWAWQSRSVRVLSEVIERARRADMPPIVWTLGVAGGFVGRCSGRGLDDGPTRVEEFDAWLRFFGNVGPNTAHTLTAWPDRTDERGVRHLHATGTLSIPAQAGALDFSLVAEVYPQITTPGEATE